VLRDLHLGYVTAEAATHSYGLSVSSSPAK